MRTTIDDHVERSGRVVLEESEKDADGCGLRLSRQFPSTSGSPTINSYLPLFDLLISDLVNWIFLLNPVRFSFSRPEMHGADAGVTPAAKAMRDA